MIEIIIGIALLIVLVILRAKLNHEPFRCAAGWHDDEKKVIEVPLFGCPYRIVKSTCRRCGRIETERDGAPF